MSELVAGALVCFCAAAVTLPLVLLGPWLDTRLFPSPTLYLFVAKGLFRKFLYKITRGGWVYIGGGRLGGGSTSYGVLFLFQRRRASLPTRKLKQSTLRNQFVDRPVESSSPIRSSMTFPSIFLRLSFKSNCVPHTSSRNIPQGVQQSRETA